MATTADFRNGISIKLQDEVYTIVAFQHVKPGKGGAFVRTKLKSFISGKIFEKTFNAGVKITIVYIERKNYQFLYKDGEDYHFMDTTTFENITLMAKMIKSPCLLKEGQEVKLVFDTTTNQLLSCELPTFVWLQVEHTEPGLKGDTVTKALKTAVLETGISIQVPLFVNINDIIKVDTATSSYIERKKLGK
jgi:elongation factor P